MSLHEAIEDLRENVLPFRPHEALERAETLAKKHPDNAENLFFLATIYKSLSRLSEAAKTFERCHSVDQSSYMAIFNGAICLWEQGKPEEALEQFARASTLAETDSILPALLTGATHHRLGAPDRAIECYQAPLKVAPTNAALLYCLMNAERDLGHHKQAEQHLRQLQKGFKRYSESSFDLVEFLQGYDYFGWKQWSDKDAFAKSIQSWCQTRNKAWPDFLPATFVMPGDMEALKAKARLAKDPIWIVKSTTLSASVGTHLVNEISNIKPEPGWIAQDYVKNPYLIKGRKFAIRIYALVSSYNPVRVYLFQGGTAKIALRKYTTDPSSFHLTSVHTEHTRPDRHRDDLKAELAADIGEKGWWTVDKLFLHLEKEGLRPAEIWNQARDIVSTLIAAMIDNGFFDSHAPDGILAAYGPKFIALDLVLDENAKLWLSEIERGPTFNRIFNSDGTEGAIFESLAQMAVCPFGDEHDREAQVMLAKAHEQQHQGRFTLLYG
ncbi:MAG: tetratricopeptide repeat protein [Alphaproteobacteria bacterium]